MLKEVTLSIEEINKVVDLLAACPLMYAMPVVDYLRELVAQKEQKSNGQEAQT